MRVFNQSKTEELQEYDQSLGYLQNDTLVTHFPEVQAVKEQGHYKVIAEYPNGGKDVEWIVDVEGVEYQPEHDEEEDILVYIPYTQKELQERERQSRIAELKNLLFETDYKAIKYAEGELSAEDYEETKLQRRAWRAEINELEAESEE